MERKVAFAPGEWYHLYNRGTDKRKIFLAKKDYERFLSLLFFANSKKPVRLDNLQRHEQGETLLNFVGEYDRGEPLVDLAAYCLMPNHFHLLIRELGDGNASNFMQKLSTGYTVYFNKRYERTGSLFQGVFKSVHITTDRQLKHLVSYIHLNPIKLIEPEWKETGVTNQARAEAHLNTYRYSSYPDYCTTSSRQESPLIHKQALLAYVDTPKDFKASITEWLSHSTE